MSEVRRWQALVPFAVISVIGLATLLVPPYATSEQPYVGALGLVAMAGIGALAVRVPRESAWFILPPLLFFLVLGLARLAAGGTTSGISPLVIVPMLWVVLYGRRWQLFVCAGATALLYLGPVAVIGPPEYDTGDLRRGLIWLAAIGLASPPVQASIERLRTTSSALATAERRWAGLLEHLPEAMVLVVGKDLDCRIAVGAGVQRLGLHGLTGRTLYELEPLVQGSRFEADCRAALAGTPAEREVVWRDRHVVLTVVPLPPGVDGPEIMIVAHDVTDDRRREATLRILNERFERIFNDAPHGEMLIDATGSVTRANPAIAAILGVRPGEVEGRPVGDLPFITEREQQEVDALLRGRRDHVTTERSLPVEGGVRDVVVTAVAVRNEQGPREVLVTVVDVSELKAYERRLARLADTDPLTGLANRRKFDAELQLHLERCRRYGATGAVIMLDLDNLKQINDQLGHGAGDRLIVAVADALRRRMRSVDVVARLGGDEFAVLLPQADRESATRVAADITRLIAQQVVVEDGARRPFSTTASVGVLAVDDPLLTAGDVMSTVDMTMYDAKDAGRNRYVVHDPVAGPVSVTRDRNTWARRISQALEDGRMVAYAQPVLDLRTDRICGAELLCRMIGEDGEVIAPARFLHVAERTGQIGRIDQFMLEQARSLAARLGPAHPEFQVHVNVSGRSLGDAEISLRLRHLLEGAGPHVDHLVLELTETAAVANVDVARDFAAHVAELGCRFALDDFGAGFGSFYYLKNLEFDLVKIDGEFVAKAPDNPTDRLILRSVVDVARGMGKRTVAEFVADPSILELVREYGLDYAQGYAIERPLRLPDLFERLEHDTAGQRAPV